MGFFSNTKFSPEAAVCLNKYEHCETVIDLTSPPTTESLMAKQTRGQFQS